MSKGPLPLAGIRVVELSCGIAGAYATKLFADAGAEVIKVEPPTGDLLRRWTSSGADLGGEDGALFRFLCAGKSSVVSEWAARTDGGGGAGGGHQLDPQLRDLVAGADLVVSDLSEVELASSGLLEVAGLVILSITPFGHGGPYAGRAASELTVQAECGSVGFRGRVERPPVQAGGQLAHWAAGACGVPAALAAIGHARRTGEGAHIDVSMAETMAICTNLFTDLTMSLAGRPQVPGPARAVEFPSIEPTSDGWVGFNTNTTQMFFDFMVLVGRSDLYGDVTVRPDPLKRADLAKSARAWTLAHTTDEVVEQASLFRIPVAPVSNATTLLTHEHLVARSFYVASPAGNFVQPQPPYLLSGERLGTSTRSPALGEHTNAVPPRQRPTPSGDHDANPASPLSGLKVLDTTCWWAGPGATQTFAALGADVIHVESIQRMDGMRPAASVMFADREQWWEQSAFFLSINFNKRGITLNLNDPIGRDLLKRLIEWADVVIENYTPRVFDSFGLDWSAVHEINPRAVMVRMPAYGLDGPWRDRLGFAQTIEAMCGMAWVTGYADGEPTLPRGPCDPLGGMHAAFATLVALTKREATGEGCLVEAALVESALNVAAEQVIEHSAYGALLQRTGNRTRGIAPQGVYACLGDERWLALSVATDAQWGALRAALGEPEWASGAELNTYPGRWAAHDHLDEALAEWCAKQDVQEATDLLVAHGIPAAVVADPRHLVDHPQMRARGFFETISHPVAGKHDAFGLPYRYSGVERWVRSPAPTLGQHNAEVLSSLLGLSDDEIAGLADSGVIGDWPIL